MRAKFRHPGITLTEMTVVISVAALLVGLALPAAKTLYRSFESESGALTVISSALASARAIAAKEQRYAGIRFQMRYDPNNPLTASQYIVFIINEEPSKMDNLTIGFRAVTGLEPIKLPDTIAVMDRCVRQDRLDEADTGYWVINSDALINEPEELIDTMAFSIIFSPSGRMVTHKVRTRNRHGDRRPLVPNDSSDDIFNSPVNISYYGVGMFVQDDYAQYGLGTEYSRDRFVIADREKFIAAYNRPGHRAWSEYLDQNLGNVKTTFISPYTGNIIREQ